MSKLNQKFNNLIIGELIISPDFLNLRNTCSESTYFASKLNFCKENKLKFTGTYSSKEVNFFKTNSDISIFGLINGPFNNALNLYDFNTIMLNIMKNELLVIKYLTKYKKSLILELQRFYSLEVNTIVIGDDISSNSGEYFHKEYLNKYLKPFYQDVILECKKLNIKLYFHSCGKLINIIEFINECGFHGLHGFEMTCNDLSLSKNHNITILGGFDFFYLKDTTDNILSNIDTFINNLNFSSQYFMCSSGGLTQNDYYELASSIFKYINKGDY